MTEANSVNDSPWLTHEMVTAAIRMTDPAIASATVLRYSDECERVGASSLAAELREYAAARASILDDDPMQSTGGRNMTDNAISTSMPATAIHRTFTVGTVALHAPNKLRRFPVNITVELTDERLSICGSYGDPAGRYGGGGQCRNIFDDPTFIATWPAERIAQLRDIWTRWHLNDMRAGCEHQRAENWDKRPIDPSKPTDTYGLHFDGQRHASWNILGWVRPDEHPDGLLTRPCDECGYRYGSAWLSEPIPTDVRAVVESWR